MCVDVTCAALRSELCCRDQAAEGLPLCDGAQTGVLGGVLPGAVQRAVHVFVPATGC